MRHLSLLALTLSTLVACGNSDTEPEPEPETPQIGGTWDYAYAVSNFAAQLSSNG